MNLPTDHYLFTTKPGSPERKAAIRAAKAARHARIDAARKAAK